MLMINKSYSVLDNGNEVMLTVNVLDIKSDTVLCFERDDNHLLVRYKGKAIARYKNISYNVWDKINSGKCFLVEFGPLGAVKEHDVILS